MLLSLYITKKKLITNEIDGIDNNDESIKKFRKLLKTKKLSKSLKLLKTRKIFKF